MIPKNFDIDRESVLDLYKDLYDFDRPINGVPCTFFKDFKDNDQLKVLSFNGSLLTGNFSTVLNEIGTLLADEWILSGVIADATDVANYDKALGLAYDSKGNPDNLLFLVYTVFKVTENTFVDQPENEEDQNELSNTRFGINRDDFIELFSGVHTYHTKLYEQWKVSYEGIPERVIRMYFSKYSTGGILCKVNNNRFDYTYEVLDNIKISKINHFIKDESKNIVAITIRDESVKDRELDLIIYKGLDKTVLDYMTDLDLATNGLIDGYYVGYHRAKNGDLYFDFISDDPDGESIILHPTESKSKSFLDYYKHIIVEDFNFIDEDDDSPDYDTDNTIDKIIGKEREKINNREDLPLACYKDIIDYEDDIWLSIGQEAAEFLNATGPEDYHMQVIKASDGTALSNLLILLFNNNVQKLSKSYRFGDGYLLDGAPVYYANKGYPDINMWIFTQDLFYKLCDRLEKVSI